MQETWISSLGQEDTLGEGIATHSGILAWRIPWTKVHEYWKNYSFDYMDICWHSDVSAF